MQTLLEKPEVPGITQKTIRCAIYTRVSTEEQAKKTFSSLDAQRQTCEDFIRSKATQGWVLYPERFEDPGLSGKDLNNRPGVQRLIKAVKDGKIQVIVIYKIDRLVRNLIQQLELTTMLGEKGVKLFAEGQEMDFISPGGFMTTSVLGAAAQMERMMTAQRTRDKIREAKKQGMWCGGHIPLGYDRSDAKELIPNPDEAVQVKAMFDLYLKEQSLDRALKLINAKYQTKEWTTQEGRRIVGKRFSKTTLIYILKNRLYLGQIPSGGQWGKGKHEAIVDEATFDKVQKLFAQNGHSRTSSARLVAKNKQGLLLKGLVRCEACGSVMTSYHSNGRGNQRYDYYKCTKSQHEGIEACPVKQVPARQLEQLVVDRMAELAGDPELVKKAVKAMVHNSANRLPALKAELVETSAKHRKIEDQANGLLQGFSGTAAQGNGFVVRRLNELEAELKTVQEQEARLKMDIDAQKTQAVDPEAARKSLMAFQGLYAHLETEEKQQLFRLAVREVRYDGIGHQIKLSLHPWGDEGSFGDSGVKAVQFGSPTWTRTRNPSINSRMLHH